MPTAFDIEGVNYDSAKAWLQGKFFVSDVIADAPGIVLSPKQVVFVNHMGRSIPAALNRVRQLGDGGCDEIIAHVASPKLRDALLGRGMVVSFTENIDWEGNTNLPAWRMYGDKQAFGNWLKRLDAGFLNAV